MALRDRAHSERACCCSYGTASSSLLRGKLLGLSENREAERTFRENERLVRTPVDAFLLAKLEKLKLSPADS